MSYKKKIWMGLITLKCETWLKKNGTKRQSYYHWQILVDADKLGGCTCKMQPLARWLLEFEEGVAIVFFRKLKRNKGVRENS